jgi:formamidase
MVLLFFSHRLSSPSNLGVYATSRHIPGVRFAGVTHPGLIGTAPSPELLATWNERETGLIQANATSVPPVAFAPLATGAYVGQDLDPKVREKIYREGARTVPGREHGGNCDVSLSLQPCNATKYIFLGS